jgi:hypothetical protein
MSQGAIDDGNTSEGRSKGRRELSTSKRAAQNRAAQVRVVMRFAIYSTDHISAHSVSAKKNTLNS